MPQLSLENIKKRSDKAWQEKQKWNDILEDAYEYAMPNRDIIDKQASGQSNMDRVYDSTAIESTQSFASTLQNKLTPPFQDWFDLTAGPLIPNKQKEQVNRKLSEIAEKVQAVFNMGSFNQATHEFYLDLCTGTAAMLVQETNNPDNPVKFNAVNQSSVAFEEGANKEIDSIYRKMCVKGRAIKRQWSDAELPSDLKEHIDKNPGEEYDFLEATYKAKRSSDSVPNDTKWYYDVIWEGGNDGEEENRIVEREREDNPWVIARWSVMPGENQGRGPLLFALPDIRTLNKAVEMTLKNASLAMAGVYTVANDGVTNPDNINIAPGAMIPVSRNGGPNGPSIQQLEVSRGFDIGQLVIDDLRMQIKKTLFDNKLPPQDIGTPRSATEVSQRIKELQQQIGGSFGRLFKEFIVPLIQRVINILAKKGMIDLPVSIDNLGVRVKVTSPLAKGQNLNDIQKVTQWLDTVAQLAGPESIQVVAKMGRISKWLATQLGVPSGLVRSEAESQQMLQQIRKNAIQARKNSQQVRPEPEASEEAVGVE